MLCVYASLSNAPLTCSVPCSLACCPRPSGPAVRAGGCPAQGRPSPCGRQCPPPPSAQKVSCVQVWHMARIGWWHSRHSSKNVICHMFEFVGTFPKRFQGQQQMGVFPMHGSSPTTAATTDPNTHNHAHDHACFHTSTIEYSTASMLSSLQQRQGISCLRISATQQP